MLNPYILLEDNHSAITEDMRERFLEMWRGEIAVSLWRCDRFLIWMILGAIAVLLGSAIAF